MRNQNWWQSFKNAINGCAYAFKTQRNFKVHFLISLLVLVFSLWLRINLDKFLFLLLAIFLGLTIEMANTAFEKTLDAVSEKYDPKIKIAKDVSAGMMLLVAGGVTIVGLLILLPPLLIKLGLK
ncbi:MAG: diacylglycerol kinase family protein [Microgenomates group bacterium]